jgi:hypothetical protein
MDEIDKITSETMTAIENEVSKRGPDTYLSSKHEESQNLPCRHNVKVSESRDTLGSGASISARVCELKVDDKAQQALFSFQLKPYDIQTSGINNRCPFANNMRLIRLCQHYEPKDR